MKFLPALFLLLLPLPALAQTAPASPAKAPASNVQIIDGKKFFSLANVRRHEGTGLSPSALSVLNNPRTDTRLPQTERLAMTPVSRSALPAVTNSSALPWAKPDAPTIPIPSTAGSAAKPPLTGADAQKAALLSIFAPDDTPTATSATK